MPEQFTTTVSTKGQVILPKAIRRALRWEAGTRLLVENRREGVLLKRQPVLAETRPQDVFACLAWDGPPKSLEHFRIKRPSLPRRRESRVFRGQWIPACAGMTIRGPGLGPYRGNRCNQIRKCSSRHAGRSFG